jgi:tight adherence protein B
MMVALLSFIGALSLGLTAAILYLRARARDHEAAEQLRLRALGGDDVAASGSAPGLKPANLLLRWICHFLWRSGSEVEPETVRKILWLLLALVPLTLMIVGWFGGLFLIGVVLAVGFLVLTQQAARRRNRIIEQLPVFLESVIRVLAAGNTLEESIASATRESSNPLRPLFMSVGRQVRLGAPIEGVLMELGEIHQISDLKILSLAASINRKYGGSLKNILKSLIQAIRQRDMSARELRALTAETRFSAVVLAIIPIGISLFIAIQNRQYYANMWNDSTGRVLLIVSVLMQICGIFVIWRMMRSTEDPV